MKLRRIPRPPRRGPSLRVFTVLGLLAVSAAAIAALLLPARAAFAEEIHLKDGSTVQGKIVERTDDYVKVRVQVGRIHYDKKIYTWQIDRIVSDAAAAEPEPKPEAGPTPTPKPKPPVEAEDPAAARTRTAAEVERLIRTAGAARCDWWDDVKEDWPKTLDLTWKQAASGWAPQRNLGAYLILIRRQPQAWKPAVKLMHKVLEVNKADAAKSARSMRALAFLYKSALGDYARAAYWLKKLKVSSVRKRVGDYVDLADCYFRLGCQALAEKELRRLPSDARHNLSGAIRLLGLLGRKQRAKSLAAAQAKGRFAGEALLAYADACRTLGDYDDAIDAYKKLLQISGGGPTRPKQRAQASLEAVEAFKNLDVAKLPDGEYRAESPGYRGPVEVRAVVRGGRIDVIHIGQHREDWFAGTFEIVPAQIIQRQSLNGIDAVSGATYSSEAVLNATGKALANGAK